MKSYTDIEQSKKLAEILPMESADQTWERIAIAGDDLDIPEEMEYWHNGNVPCILNSKIGIPCWSLAALLEILPDHTTIMVDTLKNGNRIYSCDSYEYGTPVYENSIDACYEMILKLKEIGKI